MQLLTFLLAALAGLSIALAQTNATYTSICPDCANLLSFYINIAKQGDAAFASQVANLCTVTGIEDEDVCYGVLQQQGPLLAKALREMTVPSHTSDLLCIVIFGLCPLFPPVRPWQLEFPKSQPDQPRAPYAGSGRAPIQVVQFSDIHVDLDYVVGSNDNCTKPICCRVFNATTDAPGITPYPAAEFGSALCDSPVGLEESMYAAAQELAPDAEFALFTGDIIEGAVWLVDEAGNKQGISDAYGRMSDYFETVYGTLGNHEAAPVNAFPPDTNDTTSGRSAQWVYDTVSAAWAPFIGALPAEFAKQYGAYSRDHSDKLKIISFNSNFYYKQDYWLYTPDMQLDPFGQFQWLIGELQNAEDGGQSAWLMAHMPMGSSSALNDPSNYFNQIVERYKDTITGMFFGHTHKDQFEISYRDYTHQTARNAMATSYIAPSLTPHSGAPSFRVYTIDPDSYRVLDYETYTADLEQEGCYGPLWSRFYGVKESYGALLNYTDPSAELTPAFWHNVTELFETNDAVFQTYIARRNGLQQAASCTGSCKSSEICGLRGGEAQYNCVVPKKGINFKRDEQGAASHRESEDSCGAFVFDTVSRSLLAGSGVQALLKQ